MTTASSANRVAAVDGLSLLMEARSPSGANGSTHSAALAYMADAISENSATTAATAITKDLGRGRLTAAFTMDGRAGTPPVLALYLVRPRSVLAQSRCSSQSPNPRRSAQIH